MNHDLIKLKICLLKIEITSSLHELAAILAADVVGFSKMMGEND